MDQLVNIRISLLPNGNWLAEGADNLAPDIYDWDGSDDTIEGALYWLRKAYKNDKYVHGCNCEDCA